MSNKNLSKNIYLLSFIPSLIYWYLEETQTIQIAVIAGVSLAILEVIAEKVFVGHVHSLSRLNLIILLILGPISLLANEGIWFKLQPFFTGFFLFIYLILNIRKGNSLMYTMSVDMSLKNKMPKEFLLILEKHLAYFLLLFGIFMGYLARYQSTSTWAFFKTIGFYLAFFVFMIFEMILLRKSFSQDKSGL